MLATIITKSLVSRSSQNTIFENRDRKSRLRWERRGAVALDEIGRLDAGFSAFPMQHFVFHDDNRLVTDVPVPLVARGVLFFADFDYRMLATRSKIIRTVRNLYWAYSARRPFLAHWFFKCISGVW